MSQSNVDDFERIVGKKFFVADKEAEKLILLTAAKNSYPKVHKFSTIDGQMFVVEEEDFEKPIV
jgi:hypothetical protein